MSYMLYGKPGTASMCVHWMLIELGVAFEFRTLDFAKNEQKDPAYLKINPSGQVPALVHDGRVITESTVRDIQTPNDDAPRPVRPRSAIPAAISGPG